MFYLTLTSNSSMEYFPDNTVTKYTPSLPQTVDLDGSWEVGLAEIQYPHSWYNVKQSGMWLRLHNRRGKEKHLRIHHFDIPESFYANPRKLVKKIDQMRDKASSTGIFTSGSLTSTENPGST